MTKKRGVIGAVAIVLIILGALFIPGSPFGIAKKPCPNGCNVVLIMIDTLAAQHIATYGYNRDTLPRTSAFFEEQGVIFENAHSNSPWTLPSFIGMYFSDLGSAIRYRELEDGTRPNLQRELRNAGYTLRAVVPAPNIFITDAITRLFKPEELRLPNYESIPTFTMATEQLGDLSTEQNPFFLLVHTFEVHDPFSPQPPYNELFETTPQYPTVTMNDMLMANGKDVLDEKQTQIFELRYDQGIAQADANIAGFLESIPEERLADTAIILSADHGEAFGEHGKVWHAQSLYQEEIHIPLMMHIPGVKPMRITEPVSLMDIAPTILSVSGVAIPETFKGDDLMTLVRGGSLGERVIPFVNGKPFYLSTISAQSVKTIPLSLEASGALNSEEFIIEPESFAVRIGSLKAVVTALRFPIKLDVALYDLAQDPSEEHNLFREGVVIPAKLIEPLNTLLFSIP